VSVQSSSGLSKADRVLVKEAALPTLLRGALGDLGLTSAVVNCRLTTPAELRRLNRRFAHLDQVTDVLAFPADAAQAGSDFLLPPGEERLLGDIVISVATAAGQSEAGREGPPAELRLLAVHGLLHLLGHDHGEPAAAARMGAATAQLLRRDAARRGALPPLVAELQTHA
jgi:probable rRNA maturation factor